MEYERIIDNNELQIGIISPSKLRMKLMGLRKKHGGSKSNSQFLNTHQQEEVSSLTFDTKQGHSSSVHPIRPLQDDDNLDYDSNASSSSFEFHRLTHNPIATSLLRPMSSKWNDAEKWIINKHIMHNHNPKHTMQNPGGTVNVIKASSDPHLFSSSTQTNEASKSTESKHLNEIDTSSKGCHEVSMRDMGTEMTPMPSQEPSMTSTPVGSITPLRSPNSSIPSTPRGGPTTTPVQHMVSDCLVNPKELTEQELKLRTRKEILHLGMQLGKMNIAAWASKEETEKKASSVENENENAAQESLRIEFEKRAAAWEDAEKSKHNARFVREEIKIQAWESQQKAKLEAEMKRIEAEIEQRRAHAQAKMLKNIALARQKSEKKMAAAEAQRSKQAARAAAQAEYIRQTGRIPPSSPNSCCGWS